MRAPRLAPTFAPLLVPLVLAAGATALDANDPEFVIERARLLSQDADTGDLIGLAVDIDGDRMVVGAPGNADFGDTTGSAYVFVRVDGSWLQEAKLTASNATAGDRFGSAVAIDGDTVIVTAPVDGLSGAGAGSAYVFTRSGATWTEEARFSGLDTDMGDQFGSAVALSGDTAVIGARLSSAQDLFSGAAYVFTRSGSTWSQEAQLVPSASTVFLGYSVDIDGDSAILGSWSAGVPYGPAFVFVRSPGGSTWMEQATLWGGLAVALAGDVAAVGDTFAGGMSFFGEVSVFERTGASWGPATVLRSSSPLANERFGQAVALVDDLLLVGSLSDVFGAEAGACELFQRSGPGAWSPVQRFAREGLMAGDHFGWDVALSGCTLAVGTPGLDTLSSGAVHTFELFDGDVEPGAPFCFGTGCPCGNDDPNAGCVNSTGVGASLTAVGSASVSADDLVLVAENVPGFNSGLFILGGAPFAPIAVGDGLVCTGGLFRFPPSQVTPTGTFTLQAPGALAPGDAFPVGSTRHFQAWTRDVLCGPPPLPCPSPCGAGSNLTNGYAVTMTP